MSVGAVFRGICLDPKDAQGLKLKPFSHARYISFSEDLEIAKTFADMDHDMSAFFRASSPYFKGYLISHSIAGLHEVMFHWNWAKELGLKNYLGHNIESVMEQKEVIIYARGQVFDLTPFDRGSSNKALNMIALKDEYHYISQID